MIKEPYDKWLDTSLRILPRLTDRGKELVDDLDTPLDIGWSVADAYRYWRRRRANMIRVALLERAVRKQHHIRFYNAGYKAGRRAFANELHAVLEKANLTELINKTSRLLKGG